MPHLNRADNCHSSLLWISWCLIHCHSYSWRWPPDSHCFCWAHIKNYGSCSLANLFTSRMPLQIQAFPVLMTVSFKLGVQMTCSVSLDITPSRLRSWIPRNLCPFLIHRAKPLGHIPAVTLIALPGYSFLPDILGWARGNYCFLRHFASPEVLRNWVVLGKAVLSFPTGLHSLLSGHWYSGKHCLTSLRLFAWPPEDQSGSDLIVLWKISKT